MTSQLLPEKVRRNLASLGEAGRAWLADLPRCIADIERRWAIKVGKPSRGGAKPSLRKPGRSTGETLF